MKGKEIYFNLWREKNILNSNKKCRKNVDFSQLSKKPMALR